MSAQSDMNAIAAVRYRIKQEIASERAKLVQQIAFLDSINTGCAMCDHRALNGVGCALANGLEPPDEVKAAGCDSWLWDQIPF